MKLWQRRQFCGKCPDLKIRHHFCRKAVKGALFIAEIREETVDFTTVSYQAATEVHFARIQRCGIYNAGFECLGGIWNWRWWKDNLFKEVVIATLSQNSDVICQ